MAQIHCNFFSYSLGFGIDLTLLLPSMTSCDMGDLQKRTHRLPAKFPVLYLLHGHGNDYMTWNRFTSIERYAEERRIAVVSVSVGNKSYMNAEYGEKYSDLIAHELPEFLQAYVPISNRREDTYIAGASMGGYGALAHALGHPESFRAVGAFSPATDRGEETLKRLGHSMPKMMSLYHLLDENLVHSKVLPDIFCCIGSNDFLLDAATQFHQYLTQKNVLHVFRQLDGYGHEWRFWDAELPVFLDWLPRTDIYAQMEQRYV